jgi:hypothetical protein
MFLAISGAALVIISIAVFCFLLPGKGRVNPLVENSSVGSMVTIAIMSTLTFGLAMFFEGLFG